MKIMHFIHGLNTGGAETLVKNYFLNFNKNKNEYLLLCLEHVLSSPYEELLKRHGVKMIFVEDLMQNEFFLRFFKKIYIRVKKFWVVRKIIREEKPDIIHFHLMLNKLVKFARPKKGTKLFYTVHSEPKKLWNLDSRGRKEEFLAAKWLVGKYGMRFIVLHEKMRKEINEMFNVDNSVILKNGIDVQKYRLKYDKGLLKQKFGIPENAFVVGHVGRLSGVKNHKFLIQVFAEIKKTKKDAFLLLVGSGEMEVEIKKEIKEKGLEKSFMILSNRDDMPEIFAMMDAFVFPSFWEGMPTAVIEAQESRLPCFISDAIPKEAIISNTTEQLPLELGAVKWAEKILNYEKPKRIIVNDEDWDIK